MTFVLQKKKKMRLRQEFITAYQTWKLCLRPFAIGISQFSCSILLTSRFLSHFWLWPALLATVSAFASQQTFTCSKSTIEKLEKGEKHVQSKQKRHQNDAIALMLKPSKHISFQNLLKSMFNLSTYFTPFANVSIVDFKQVIASTFPQPYELYSSEKYSTNWNKIIAFGK